VRLVNWADEEGARFGRSLFGSSAAAGSMATRTSCARRSTRTAIALPDARRGARRRSRPALDARSQLENAAAYLELHIEQGPVLESMDLPLGVVLGTFGVERHSSRSAARRRTPARRRWTSAATRSPARRSSSSRSARSRNGRAGERCARWAAS
jgi:N-carbamoyl-L-amino-acid hydrolase